MRPWMVFANSKGDSPWTLLDAPFKAPTSMLYGMCLTPLFLLRGIDLCRSERISLWEGCGSAALRRFNLLRQRSALTRLCWFLVVFLNFQSMRKLLLGTLQSRSQKSFTIRLPQAGFVQRLTARWNMVDPVLLSLDLGLSSRKSIVLMRIKLMESGMLQALLKIIHRLTIKSTFIRFPLATISKYKCNDDQRTFSTNSPMTKSAYTATEMSSPQSTTSMTGFITSLRFILA